MYATRPRTDNTRERDPLDIRGEFAIAQNGTIANTEDLEPIVQREFPILGSTTDTKLAGYRLLQHYLAEQDWTRAFHKLSKELSGSYSFVMIPTTARSWPRGTRQAIDPFVSDTILKQNHIVAARAALSQRSSKLLGRGIFNPASLSASGSYPRQRGL